VNQTKYILLVSKHSLIHTQKFSLIFHTLTKSKIVSKIVPRVKMQKNHKVLSQLLAALTRVWSCAELVIDLVPFLSYWLLLSERFKSGDLSVHARQCTMQCTSSQGNSGWSLKRCSGFCNGKDVWQHCSSHNTGWGPIQRIFSWMLFKATDNCFFFAFWHVILLCLVSWLK